MRTFIAHILNLGKYQNKANANQKDLKDKKTSKKRKGSFKERLRKQDSKMKLKKWNT